MLYLAKIGGFMKQSSHQQNQSSLINPGDIWIGRFSSHEVEIVSVKPSSDNSSNTVTYVDESDNIWTNDFSVFQKRFQLVSD